MSHSFSGSNEGEHSHEEAAAVEPRSAPEFTRHEAAGLERAPGRQNNVARNCQRRELSQPADFRAPKLPLSPRHTNFLQRLFSPVPIPSLCAFFPSPSVSAGLHLTFLGGIILSFFSAVVPRRPIQRGLLLLLVAGLRGGETATQLERRTKLLQG